MNEARQRALLRDVNERFRIYRECKAFLDGALVDPPIKLLLDICHELERESSRLTVLLAELSHGHSLAAWKELPDVVWFHYGTYRIQGETLRDAIDVLLKDGYA